MVQGKHQTPNHIQTSISNDLNRRIVILVIGIWGLFGTCYLGFEILELAFNYSGTQD
jgi:hypothetical protein